MARNHGKILTRLVLAGLTLQVLTASTDSRPPAGTRAAVERIAKKLARGVEAQHHCDVGAVDSPPNILGGLVQILRCMPPRRAIS